MMRQKVSWLILLLATAGFSVAAFAPDAQAKYIDAKNVKMTVNVRKPHYVVHFDANANDEEEGEMDNQEFIYGTERALTLNAYTREGYLFKGWNTKANVGDGGYAYSNGQRVLNLNALDGSVVDGEVVTLYAQWEEVAMHEVFRVDGVCVFNGGDEITGDADCPYANRGLTYIDTGVKLYSEENYYKDFELGFTIVSYTPGANVNQAVFANSKLESEAEGYPGIVVRRSGNDIEIAQTINGEKETARVAANRTTKVVITRVGGIMYYAFNDGDFRVLQDMGGTPQYFDTTVWFGAAENMDGGGPFRYLNGTLSNLYITMGESNSQTITFHAHCDGVEGCTDPSPLTVVRSRRIGDVLPTPVKTGYVFAGWFTEENGQGTRIKADTVLTEDIDAHAHWREDNNVCEVGGVGFESLAACLNAAVDVQGRVEIKLVRDTHEHITIPVGMDIEFDLDGFVMGDDGSQNKPVINNLGTVTIKNGTLTSKMGAGVFDNAVGANLYMTGGQILATGSRQAIYNNGGYVEISGDAYLRATTSERAAVHNLNNGTLVVTGGTIISTRQDGIKNESGSVTLGVAGGGIDVTTPVIQGGANGVTTTPNITMYDGILKGKTAAINNASKITTIETGATAVTGTELIDGVTYQTLHYEISAP